MKKFLLILIIALFSFRTNGQNKEEFDKLKEELKELKDLVLNKNDVEFGKIDFVLNDISSSLYKNKTVDKIEFEIYDGCFYDVKVYIGNHIYTNPSAPIAITNNRLKNKIDNLFNTANGKDTITFQDLINKNSKFKPYSPENNISKINKDTLSYILKKDLSLNSLLELRIMSDALAFLSNESNGIIQTEVKTKFILSRGNYPNSSLIFLNYFKIKLNYNKLDSNMKTIDLLNYSSSDLLQKSILNTEISLNSLKFNFPNFKSKNLFYTDFGFSFSSNEVELAAKKFTISTYSFFIDTGINLKLYDEVDFSLNNRLIRLMSPETKGYNGNLNEYFINFNEITFDLQYHLNKAKKTKLFFRVNYFRPINGLSVSENQFTQVQVGYSKLFTDLF